MATQTFKVVVYGADLQGVFAAAKAAAELTSSAANGKVALIVPYPKTRYKNASGYWVEDYLLGGIMTAGGLNNWDDSGYFKSKNPSQTAVQKGSYFYYRTSLGLGFDRIALSDKCKASMTNGNVTIFYGQDIYTFTAGGAPYKISSVTISPISRDSQGRVVWTNTATKTTLNASVFIDASTDGRIARKVNTACTVGRYCWPTQYLKEADEKAATDYVCRQQAATIMVKMRNIAPYPYYNSEGNLVKPYSEYDNTTVASSLWTPHDPYLDPNGSIAAFNNAHKDSDRIMIKPANAARDGETSNEWWVNGLLIFDVDGRAHYRDEASNTTFKVTRKYNYMTTDEAWLKAKNFVRNYKSELEAAFSTYNGFANATIVTDDHGDPVIGDQLYIRETVHMAASSGKRAHNSETNYHITSDESKNAGTGADQGNYATRIGLAKYDCDIHPYQPSDYVDEYGNYIANEDSYRKMRDDMVKSPGAVYVPYEAIKTSYVANLLIPGYAAGVCSYSWGELRVFSNLSVLGDAAGIAAGYCCNKGIEPYVLATKTADIQALQTKIREANGKIDK